MWKVELSGGVEEEKMLQLVLQGWLRFYLTFYGI
jgi:hypothetical protein